MNSCCFKNGPILEIGLAMTRMNVTAVCIALIIATGAIADMSPPPFATSAVSRNGLHVVRVTPGKRQDGKQRAKDQVTVYSYTAESDSYVRSDSFDLGTLRPSEMLFVSDDGRHLVFVNIGHYLGKEHLGIRVYNKTGKLLKRWSLAELLTSRQIKGSAKTGSTTQWFENGEIDGGVFSFHGPARTVKGLGHTSFTIMRYGDEDCSFEIDVDLHKLKIAED